MRLELLVLLAAPCAYGFMAPASPTIRNVALRSAATSQLPEGLLKTVSVEGKGMPIQLGDIATVKYSCYLPEDAANGSGARSTPFAKSPSQKVVVGDGTMIVGWEKALRTMRIGERSIIRITNPEFAYGVSGVPPLIPSNAVVELDVQVLDANPATANIDFDSLATMDNTPRTASDIAAAFEARQAAGSGEPELEGFEKFLFKAKNFYFYGLFEGETGERPPWFLRPSITFPLAFAIVGAAFYVSLAGGAISERGAQIKDELDEIILSSNGMAAMVTALLTTPVDISM
jgi:hypothetical protein